jgi:xanthine dehydrogenase YagS FAD-binding subunit
VEPFTYVKQLDEAKAIADGATARTVFIAGGTTLIDLMRLEVLRPTALIDITGLPYDKVEESGGGVKIGALVRNSDLAYHPLIAKRYPVLAEALLAGASPQLRNLATTGGNLLQRTRCPYFRDPQTSACNKRVAGSGCAALGGFNRSHAVLGTSGHCIATNPSDMAVALVALEAVVHVKGAKGPRTIPIDELHTLPGDRPDIEHVLEPGELITHVELPASKLAARSHYLKVRDRASYAFALASAAVALDLGAGTIQGARIALGGVATKPWRSREAEAVLTGKRGTVELYRAAAEAALSGARGQRDNQFKIELAKRTLVRALVETVVIKGSPA